MDKLSNQIKQFEDQLLKLKRNGECLKANDATMKFEAMTPGDLILGRDSIVKKVESKTEQSDDPSANIASVENGESASVVNDGSLPTSDDTSTSNVSKIVENVYPKAHGIEKIKGKPFEVASVSDASKINTNGVSDASFSEGM